MDRLFLGTELSVWALAAAVFLVMAFGLPILQRIVRRAFPADDPNDRSWRGLVGALNARWMRGASLLLALGCALLTLGPDPRTFTIVRTALIVILTVQAVRLIPVLIDWALLRLAARSDPASPAAAGTLGSLRWLILLAAYTILLLLALQNSGVDVTSLIAGLGIGGIAVALALQNVLGDLFASLTIALDKPFVIGDFIVVGSEMGAVEHIGLKTTRVRSLSGEQLVFGNADLLSSRIRNYKRMSERRVLFGFGVVYDTPPDTLEAINSIVRAAVESQSNVRFDRCHFHRFGPSSLDFEAVYYINSPDYNAHMDAQQAVHLAIARAFRDQNIAFAFPTQTLHLVRPAPAQSPAQTPAQPAAEAPR